MLNFTLPTTLTKEEANAPLVDHTGPSADLEYIKGDEVPDEQYLIFRDHNGKVVEVHKNVKMTAAFQIDERYEAPGQRCSDCVNGFFCMTLRGSTSGGGALPRIDLQTIKICGMDGANGARLTPVADNNVFIAFFVKGRPAASSAVSITNPEFTGRLDVGEVQKKMSDVVAGYHVADGNVFVLIDTKDDVANITYAQYGFLEEIDRMFGFTNDLEDFEALKTRIEKAVAEMGESNE